MINFRLPFRKKIPSTSAKASVDREKPVSVIGLRRLNAKKTKKVSRRNLLTVLTSIILIFFVLTSFFLIKKNPFQIREIIFKNADLSCVTNEQLKNQLNLTGYNFFNLNSKKIEEQAKKKYLCISSVKIEKKFSSTIDILASDRKIVAILKIYKIPPMELNLTEATSSTKEAKLIDNTAGSILAGNFLVDEEGVIIDSKNEQTDLPIIDYYHQNGELKLGNKIPGNIIAKTLKILSGLTSQSINFNQAKIVDQGLFLKGEKELIFSLNKDMDKQLASLQLILHQATIDSKSVQKVDLRFDKAIVVYSVL